VLNNRVTEKPRTGGTIWIVSAEWRGGHDQRKFLLENVHRSHAEALVDWERLTPENHARNFGLPPDADRGFVRHPIRVFKETSGE